jgi:hypothetical protein
MPRTARVAPGLSVADGAGLSVGAGLEEVELVAAVLRNDLLGGDSIGIVVEARAVGEAITDGATVAATRDSWSIPVERGRHDPGAAIRFQSSLR